MAELTNEEVEERIAVLKRLRFLLEDSRNTFNAFLTVLEK